MLGGERMAGEVNHLRDELRRTFTLYALIPTFIISLIVLVLAFVYWHTNVLERNQNSLDTVCVMMTKMLNRYLDKVNEVASLCDISELRVSNTARADFYENLYQFSNQQEVHPKFYLFDGQLQPILSNEAKEPETVELAKSADWGIIGRLKQTPAVPVFAFVSSLKNFGAPMDLVIGKAILEKGRITGYILFAVPATQLAGLVTNPYVQIVVKDRYDYTPVSTDPLFYDVMNKMKPEFKDAAGYTAVAGQKYYISKKEIQNGELTVYALSSIGGILSQLGNALLILLGVLVILSFSIVVSVKKQVEAKTQIMDQIVAAFSAVKDGNLEMRLAITTNNEFQIISEAYNMMLTSLKELMKNNDEKARATVISEIKQLESQFNPHFLFNTLENIKFMIKLDPAAANRMIIALSKLLRYSISRTGSEVTIKEDMEYTRNYLEIQKYRFGQRLDYVIHIPEELNRCVVPKLIFQPIIENAVKYGFHDCQHMLVDIEIESLEEQLAIRIRNNGTEIDRLSLEEIRSMLLAPANYSRHSGLYNVNRRIQLMYGEAYGLAIRSNQQEGTTVTIILPMQTEPVA